MWAVVKRDVKAKEIDSIDRVTITDIRADAVSHAVALAAASGMLDEGDDEYVKHVASRLADSGYFGVPGVEIFIVRAYRP